MGRLACGLRNRGAPHLAPGEPGNYARGQYTKDTKSGTCPTLSPPLTEPVPQTKEPPGEPRCRDSIWRGRDVTSCLHASALTVPHGRARETRGGTPHGPWGRPCPCGQWKGPLGSPLIGSATPPHPGASKSPRPRHSLHPQGEGGHASHLVVQPGCSRRREEIQSFPPPSSRCRVAPERSGCLSLQPSRRPAPCAGSRVRGVAFLHRDVVGSASRGPRLPTPLPHHVRERGGLQVPGDIASLHPVQQAPLRRSPAFLRTREAPRPWPEARPPLRGCPCPSQEYGRGGLPQPRLITLDWLLNCRSLRSSRAESARQGDPHRRDSTPSQPRGEAPGNTMQHHAWESMDKARQCSILEDKAWAKHIRMTCSNKCASPGLGGSGGLLARTSSPES